MTFAAFFTGAGAGFALLAVFATDFDFVATTFFAGVVFCAAAGFATFFAAVFLAVGFEGMRNGSGYLGTIHLLAGPAQKNAGGAMNVA